MLSLAQASVHRVHRTLRIKKPVQGISAPADCVGIHPLVHLGYRVEQAPGPFGAGILFTGTPLAHISEHISGEDFTLLGTQGAQGALNFIKRLRF